MDEGRDQMSSSRPGQASAMLLSLLFSLWLAVGGIGGGIGPTTPEVARTAPAKAVVVQSGAGKQVQQPRTPEPTAALPPSAIPVLADRLTYPADALAPASVALLRSASVSPYQARAPPAR